VLLAGIVTRMWAIEAINSLDGQMLDSDETIPREIDRIWGRA
jgi:hypothetical protein